jgi:hypothetical protein
MLRLDWLRRRYEEIYYNTISKCDATNRMWNDLFIW